MNDVCRTFPTWTSYADAYAASLMSPDSNLQFPEYAKLLDERKGDLLIVTTLLVKGYNPQEGFDLFVHACLNGTRYIKDAADWGIVSGVIHLFIEHGAMIQDTLIHTLFSHEFADIEDEAPRVAAKGIMIDTLAPYCIDISRYGDWSTIDATYWEDIPNELDYNSKFRMYLKHCSKYLQSLPAPV